MFFIEIDPPTFRRVLLDPAVLDFSLESLKHVDRYLLRIRKDPKLIADWTRTVLRAGTYVGEVIRQAVPDTFHWVDYAEAAAVDREVASYGYCPSTAAVLYKGPHTFLFPMGRVVKCLEAGRGDNTHAYVNTVVGLVGAGTL